jgi:hypothetical protein
MDKPSNVIDLKARISSRKSGVKSSRPGSPAVVVDMTERRTEIVNQERRKVKRTILTEFIGACVVLPQDGLCKVALYDVSEDGIGFDIDSSQGRFNVGEEIAMRVYLNHQTYFPFVVKITNSRVIEDEGVVRHGTSLVGGTVNDEALYHLIRFIETVSASLRTDSGDVMVSNLRP